jgi:hypothetical protein
MPSVAHKPFMLSIVVLNVFVLSVATLNVLMVSVNFSIAFSPFTLHRCQCQDSNPRCLDYASCVVQPRSRSSNILNALI